MQLRKRLLSLALSLVLVLPITLLLSPAPVVSAQTTSTLYGTGSADEINIIKLLDMALNKGGMSMSPATIKAFLDYWWDSVCSDLSTCINNADAAITTTQDFVDYVYTALEDAEHYDQLGDIIKRYVRYVLTLDAKSLADFKQLLTQEGTFRQFLLSYVVDEDGNIAGTVDNKLKKYNLKSGLVNMVRQVADAYIEEYEGYYLFSTSTYKDIPVRLFSSKSIYDDVILTLRSIPDHGVFAFTNNYVATYLNYFYDCGNINLVGKLRDDKSSFFISGTYSDDWVSCAPYCMALVSGGIDLSNFDSITTRGFSYLYLNPVDAYGGGTLLLSSDGRSIKVWKSLESFKSYSVGKSNIYYSSNYSSYDASTDNSVEFTGAYYNSTSTNYSHQNIQNTIDNSSEVNESTVNNIVNNYITNVTNNYGEGSGGSGSGDDWWNIGDGITSFVKGVAALLDFLLKLLGDLIGVISDFLIGLLEVLKRLGDVGLSFGDFLKTFFGFLPGEIIDLMVVGIGAVVVVGVIKAFKK